jgi:hypothetical protein
MDSKVGYIYIRNHWSYDIDDVYKLGKTICIPDRDQTYVTGECRRGKILAGYEIACNILDDTEELLQDIFIKLHKQHDGGEEFYRREIIGLIEPVFDDYDIEYRKLTDIEIDELKRIKRDREIKYIKIAFYLKMEVNLRNIQQLSLIQFIFLWGNRIIRR